MKLTIKAAEEPRPVFLEGSKGMSSLSYDCRLSRVNEGDGYYKMNQNITYLVSLRIKSVITTQIYY